MMSEPRDPAIKIFGAAIAPSTDPAADDKNVCGEVENIEVDARMSDVFKELDQNESSNSSGLSNCNEDDHHISTGDANAKQDRAETDTSNQEKVLRKPDKILPCPRCNSVDTKFCYFNNYNVNQPRYFCKNCNRYWTAGGSMRNVPVGAGKRKSKLSMTHHRHLMMASDAMPRSRVDAMPCSRVDASNLVAQQVLLGASSAHVRPLKENEFVLKHSPIAPLCASKSSKQITPELMRSCGESREQTCISSVSDSHHSEDDRVETAVQNGHIAHTGLSPMHLPYYHGPPFVFPWGPGCSNVSAMAAGQCSSDLFNVPAIDNQSPGSWNQPPIFTAPPFCSPTIAFPFMPTPFWGFPSWPTGTWNLPWLGSQGHLSPSLSTSKSDSAKNSPPTLGKHSRDASLEGEEQRQTKSLWVPKTLRIADPDEAAKSSIWATLGIKPGASIHKGSVFKAFQPKNATKEQTADATQVLHANPVALCRSQTFQESN